MVDPVETAVADVVSTGASSFLISFGIYIALGLIVAALAGGWYAHGVYFKAQQEAVLQDEIDKRTTAEGKVTKLQDTVDRLSDINTKQKALIDAGLVNETTKIVYKNCIVPKSGIMLLNK